MKRGLVVGLSVVVVALLAGAFLVSTLQGPASSSSGTSTSSSGSSSTTLSTGSGGYDGLQLRLAANASSTSGPDSAVTIEVTVSEVNTLSVSNNVSSASDLPLASLSLGPCGRMSYPFGVAFFKGTYTAANVSSATPLDVYPVVPCPLYIRLVTGYLFQPMSDQAAILPGSTNSTTLMLSNVTASGVYGQNPSIQTSTPLSPGTYSVAAGDEWGQLVVVHFTIGTGPSVSVSATASPPEAVEALRLA